MKEKLEKQIRDRLEEMSIDMTKYVTRWVDIIDFVHGRGVALFDHIKGHNIETKFDFDTEGDITSFRIDLEY